MRSCSKVKRALVVHDLAIGTIRDNTTSLLKLKILLFRELGEAPLVGNKHFLSSWEFVFRATERLQAVGLVRLLRTDGEQSLADTHTRHGTERLSERTTHSSLETISTGTRKHFC